MFVDFVVYIYMCISVVDLSLISQSIFNLFIYIYIYNIDPGKPAAEVSQT